MNANPEVDEFFDSATPWPDESKQLRAILLDCRLGEALKWRKPCYTFDGRNIAIIQPFKEFLALLFFKGALLEDAAGVLEEQGENTRAARRICFTDVDQVVELEPVVKNLVEQAIEVEKAGLTVPKPELVLVEELQDRLDEDPDLKAAFEALTPGRQRGYNLYFKGAKRSSTRARRVEKYIPKILAGKGLRD